MTYLKISDYLFKLAAECINGSALRHWRKDKKYYDSVKIRDVSNFELPDVCEFELPYFVIVK